MRSAAYKNYLLGLLAVILVFNYVDRLALGVLLQDIKLDLHLSDTQLGLLSGIAFALFYSIMGIPIARWADRGNRVTIISVTAVLWSVAVAACGMAGSFVQLLMIRVGVAVGEAGCIPPAYSLIADYFSRAERPRATAVYGMGGGLSAVLGFFLAGWLNELYGWRMTFVLLGAPGLILAALAWLTLREPRCAKLQETAAARLGQPSLKEVGSVLWANRTFRHLLLCLATIYFFLYGVLQWLPTLLIRSYGFTTGRLGTCLALTFGIGSLLGSYLGGAWASRHAANNERLQLKAIAIAIVCSGTLSIFVYLSGNPYVVLGLSGLVMLGLTTTNGPITATIQTLVPERMRAVAFALVFLVTNLIGMGLGPLLVGVLSDALQPWAGTESLRYALLILAPGYFGAAWHAWRASRTVARDLAVANPELSF